MQLRRSYIVVTCPLLFIFFLHLIALPEAATALSYSNLTLPGQHPHPESIALQIQRQLNVSMTRRLLGDESGCLTGNPVDDCWRCDPDWGKNRQRLADCGIGFGQYALGGKGGEYYVVTDSSDNDAVNPRPGTLRYAVVRTEPLWIVFASNMVIHLKEELIFNSYKTVDGRGAEVHITGGGCITLQYISNVIIHNIHVHHCYSTGNAMVRSSPTHFGYRSMCDGDGISLFGAKDIWIDHCSLSHCNDGLIDAIMGSTAITISNSHFSHHNEVMLLGHSDSFEPDTGMQVTIAFNVFGKDLIQRMPRCRHGYIHVVNNDFTQWEMYAIGGSASPTILSQGNRFIAPMNPYAKEVTKRVETDENDWKDWNWRSEGDILVNGAYFTASGEGLEARYEKAYSIEPRSASSIDQLTMYSGVFGSRNHNQGKWGAGPGGASDLDDDDYDYLDEDGTHTMRPSLMTCILLPVVMGVSSLFYVFINILDHL